MYTKIMVPVDGSNLAESALALAFAFGRKTGASLHFVMVIERLSSMFGLGRVEYRGDWGHEYLGNLVDAAASEGSKKSTYSLNTGNIVDELEKEQDSSGADLVVMATHGRGLIARTWFGSVADGFLRRTRVPLILVRPTDSMSVVDLETSGSTVLIPLDGSAPSESALGNVIDLGELFGAAYHLTHVVVPPTKITTPYLPHTADSNEVNAHEAREWAANYLEAIARRMRHRGLRVTTSVAVNHQVGQGILQEANAVGCDLISMVTKGKNGVDLLRLGSSIDKVVRRTHVPILLHPMQA